MSYRLMWHALDKANIRAELASLRDDGWDEEVSRVLAYMNSIAGDGPNARSQNIHMQVAGRNLHSVCPFGTVGVFYAYESPPTTQIYILAFCVDVFLNVGTAAARLNNVP